MWFVIFSRNLLEREFRIFLSRDVAIVFSLRDAFLLRVTFYGPQRIYGWCQKLAGMKPWMHILVVQYGSFYTYPLIYISPFRQAISTKPLATKCDNGLWLRCFGDGVRYIKLLCWYVFATVATYDGVGDLFQSEGRISSWANFQGPHFSGGRQKWGEQWM